MNAEKRKAGKERGKLKVLTLFFIVLALPLLSGCAEIAPPTPGYILKRPLGTDSVKVGMTKSRVKELWGDPSQVNTVEGDERWGGKREEWVYIARYSVIPVDAGYLSKTKKLYFDGDNLTNIVKE